MVALLRIAAARLVVLTMIVIARHVGVTMREMLIMALIGRGHIRVPVASGIHRPGYARPRKLPVQKREHEEAIKKPGEEAVHSSCKAWAGR